MRQPHQLLQSRARLRDRFAVFPLKGFPFSRLPQWPGVEARVLASPAIGAAFVEMLLSMRAGQGGGYDADGRVETFLYVVSGGLDLVVDDAVSEPLGPGGYALVPATSGFRCTASDNADVLVLRKVYESLAGVSAPCLLVGDAAAVPATPYLGDDGSLLQTLIPDEMTYDLAMNIFEFAPGRSLPVVETHVMEHGLWFLQGKGLYYLDDTWMEVEQNDFIWMGPYVPQSFYATGPVPSKYLYYKNVNRDIPV